MPTIKPTKNKMVIALLNHGKYLLQKLPKKHCIHHCQNGFKLVNDVYEPCPCIGQVIKIRKFKRDKQDGDKIIIGKELQKTRRKRR